MMGERSAPCQRLFFRLILACIATCPTFTPAAPDSPRRSNCKKELPMAYAPADRAFYDADSHIMELPNFLLDYADPDVRDKIPPVNYSASIVTDEEVAVIVARGKRHSDEHKAELLALGDKLIESSKNSELGAFDSARHAGPRHARLQTPAVFATHVALFRRVRRCRRARYGSARATARDGRVLPHDARLLGVGVVPLDDPAAAIAELDHLIKQNLKAVWIPHRPCGDKAPGHVEFDPFWARLVDAGVPFVLHVGGAPLQLNKAWSNNGRPPTKDAWRRRKRAVKTLRCCTKVQTFLSMMITACRTLSGTAARASNRRRCASLTRLDWVAAH
jgi:hypothetical protein